MKQNFLKKIAALTLSAAMLLTADLSAVSPTAYEAEEHICGIGDDHCGHEEVIHTETTVLPLAQYASSAVAAPTASRKSGTIRCTGDFVSTTLTAEDNSTIYYSVNGGSYKKASSPVNIQLTKNTTLKTYAENNGKKSSVVTYEYKLKPTLSFSTSDFGSSKKVWISTKPSDAKVYYTTDGSEPTTKSKKYTSSGITLTKTSTVKVLAVKSDWLSVSDSEKVTVSGSGSGSTSAIGSSSISTPSEDKANVRYNGGKMECEAKYWRSSDNYNKYDSVTISTPDGKLYIHLAADSTLKTGGTDDVVDNVKLGTTCIGIDGFKAIDGGKYHCTGPGNNYIEKATITAIALDRTGKIPTILYFYVLASDPSSGKKVALEGIVKYTISNSAGSSSGSSSSGSTGKTGSTADKDSTGGSKSAPLDVSKFTSLKVPANAGKASVSDSDEELNAKYKFLGATKSSADCYYVSYPSSSSRDKYGRLVFKHPEIRIGIATTVKFDTGDTLTLSDFTGEKSSSRIDFTDNWAMGTFNSKTSKNRFKAVKVKAVDMDYTGENPSVIYYNFTMNQNGIDVTYEGLIKVNINGSKRTAPLDPNCPICHGERLCWKCDGTGTIWDAPSKKFVKCPICEGTKMCEYCNGTGLRP